MLLLLLSFVKLNYKVSQGGVPSIYPKHQERWGRRTAAVTKIRWQRHEWYDMWWLSEMRLESEACAAASSLTEGWGLRTPGVSVDVLGGTTHSLHLQPDCWARLLSLVFRQDLAVRPRLASHSVLPPLSPELSDRVCNELAFCLWLLKQGQTSGFTLVVSPQVSMFWKLWIFTFRMLNLC